MRNSQTRENFSHSWELQSAVKNLQSKIRFGVLAQLVERLNGIEEVTGSNPVGSTAFYRVEAD